MCSREATYMPYEDYGGASVGFVYGGGFTCRVPKSGVFNHQAKQSMRLRVQEK
jgi:hypothetical protein